MFYKIELTDHVRVPPKYFTEDVKEAVRQCIRLRFDGYVDEQLGIVVDVADVSSVGEGVIIPGDGSAYYDAVFSLISFKPEMHELISGRIKEIADFGAFLTMGPIDGMIHISQTMDDFVSFGKDKVLNGKDSKRSLKVDDICRARVIAVSYKDLNNPKIGLTMRQQGLGKLDWLTEEKKPVKEAKPEAKKEKAK